jgi:hypothetical protein
MTREELKSLPISSIIDAWSTNGRRDICLLIKAPDGSEQAMLLRTYKDDHPEGPDTNSVYMDKDPGGQHKG